MATVKELNTRLDDLETRHACAEKLIIGLIAELDKAQGRITSLEDLAADYAYQLDCEAEEAADLMARYHELTFGIMCDLCKEFEIKF
ncbi:hypothetical protein [Escherichia coli]|uniref:hypothetical protein n=1 Tax=Escherichia coli TaxID=562 RepID=UPI0038B41741